MSIYLSIHVGYRIGTKHPPPPIPFHTDETTHPHVLVEAGGLAETFATDHTLVRPVFLVNVENMDTEPILLLK